MCAVYSRALSMSHRANRYARVYASNCRNAISGDETFAERAMRTVCQARVDRSRAEKLAGLLPRCHSVYHYVKIVILLLLIWQSEF